MTTLARTFARIYGPSISHSGLRNAIVALAGSSLGPANNIPIFYHEAFQRACHSLHRKLSNEVDESDLLVTYLLAAWSVSIDDMEGVEVHANGMLAIMRRLLEEQSCLFSTSGLSPLWSLARDGILWGAGWSSDKSFVKRLAHDFLVLLGPKTIQQRQRYEEEFKAVHGDGMWAMLGTELYLLNICLGVINQRFLEGTSKQDAYMESILVEAKAFLSSLDQKRRDARIESALESRNTGEQWQIGVDKLSFFAMFYELIHLLLSRLVVAALEGPSIREGLCSMEGLAASASLVSAFRQGKDFFVFTK